MMDSPLGDQLPDIKVPDCRSVLQQLIAKAKNEIRLGDEARARMVKEGTAVLYHYMAAGDALLEALARDKPRNKKVWLKKNGFVITTAFVYMRLARHRTQIEAEKSVRSALKLISTSKKSDKEPDEGLDEESESDKEPSSSNKPEAEAGDRGQALQDGDADHGHHGVDGNGRADKSAEQSKHEHEHDHAGARYGDHGDRAEADVVRDADEERLNHQPASTETGTGKPAKHVNGKANDQLTDPAKPPTMLALWQKGSPEQRDFLPDGNPGELLSDLIRIIESLDAEIFRRAACSIPHLRRCLETHLLNAHGLKRSDQLTKALRKVLRSKPGCAEQIATVAAMNKILSADKLDFTDAYVRVPKKSK